MNWRLFEKLLWIVGVTLLVVLSIVLSLFVTVDEWYWQLGLYLSIPISVLIWVGILLLLDKFVTHDNYIKRLKKEDAERRNLYHIRFNQVDSKLEYPSKAVATKLLMLQEDKAKNIEEININIVRTKEVIAKNQKQLKELETLLDVYKETKPPIPKKSKGQATKK